MQGKSNVTAEEFIRVWQNAASPAAVAKATKSSKAAAIQRAVSYRKKGVPLKRFPRGPGVGRAPLDWRGLARIAKSATPRPG